MTYLKVQVTIEETLSQTFEVEANSAEEAMELARERYNSGEYVVETDNVTNRQMEGACEENGEVTSWVEF